jgi:hypothetical protein
MVLAVVAVVIAVVVVGGIARLAFHPGSRGDDRNSGNSASESSGVTSASVRFMLPPGAAEWGQNGASTYGHWARGNEVTSCPFAENVHAAFVERATQPEVIVDAFSPVTNLHYTMVCVREAAVTCRGGNNAVVYIY